MTTNVILYVFVTFIATLIGGLLPLSKRLHPELHLKTALSGGVGVLLGMTFLHIIPEAAAHAPDEFGRWLLVGFLLLLVLERFIMVHPCEEHACNFHTVGVTAFLGLAVHALIEGAALASSLFVSDLGPLVLIAILSHKLPEGLALSTILRLAGKKTSTILWFVIGISIATPIGILLGYYFITSESFHGATSILLALASGTFLYIGACDLLPELHKSGTHRWQRLFLFLVGIAVSVLASNIPHQGHVH